MLVLLALLGIGTAPAEADRHHFIYPTLQRPALIDTHVGITEGLAFFNADDLPVGRFGAADISMSGFQQTLSFGLRMRDWLGLDLQGQGFALGGTNINSLVLRGAKFDLAGEGALLFGVLRREETGTFLTIRPHARYLSGRDLTVQPLLESVITAPTRTLESILEGALGNRILVPTRETAGGVGVHVAQAFTRAVSLQAAVDAEVTWRSEEPFNPFAGVSVVQRSRAYRVLGAAALAYDFMAHKVPIAVMGEYQIAWGRRTGDTFLGSTIGNQTVGGGVYYSGQPHLQLGLSAATYLRSDPIVGFDDQGQAIPSGDVRLRYGQLALRYLW